ncbi:MAG: glycosyltransferase family 2 protein [Armatimonadetes bacterium]|nr:glycosyltransferase family 2 protein [Armatimonadota bacterium]
MSDRPEVSVVVPMFNEEENVEATVERLKGALEPLKCAYEIVLVNDGSTDSTHAVAQAVSEREPNVSFVSYPINRGRGKAMRTGFARASGNLVCTTEADLSWGQDIIVRMVTELRRSPDADIVVASPHMPGGAYEDVPWLRTVASGIGNQILRMALSPSLTMMTGMTRAYRRHVLESMELESDGKEIHVEILSKALALDYTVKEIPAVLSWRGKKGTSKFRFRQIASSHLLLTFFERPMMLFGALGFLMLLLGFVFGVDVAVLRFTGRLTAGRPLITLVALLVIGGIQVLSFGLIGTQIAALRRASVKIQRQNRELASQLSRLGLAAGQEGGEPR